MAELPNYPFVNQLNSATLDKRPDENKWYNCVICSILSAMFYWRPELRGKITPDSMKDAVLGENYQNKGTDAAWFIDFVAKYGLKLYKIEGNPGHLVDLAHQLIQSGKPAIFTEIDPYCNDYQRNVLGWTHVCSWYKETSNGLIAMDPFGGKLIDESNAYWLEKIVGNELWTVERIDDVISIDLNTPGIGGYFTLVNGDQWQCKQTGKIIHGAILDYYRNNGTVPLCGFSSLGLPVSNEIPLQGVPGAVKQFYERGCVVYDAAHKVDNPLGAKNVYPAHLYGGVGEDPRLVPLKTQVADLQAQLAAQPTVDPAPLNAIKQAQPLIDQAQTILAPFK